MNFNRIQIFSSANMDVFADVLPEAQQIVVSFPHIIANPDKTFAFARDFLRTHGISGIYFTCNSNAWFQYPEMPEALKAAAEFAAGFRGITTYGSSMGGYAALRFAASLGASRILAVCPQFSIQHGLAPYEWRYGDERKIIDFIHDESSLSSEGVDKAYVIYDPLYRLDRLHVGRFREFVSIEDVRVFCSGHPPLGLLHCYGVITELILDLLAGEFDQRKLRSAERSGRRMQAGYWRELAWRMVEHKKSRGLKEVCERHIILSADKVAAEAHRDCIHRDATRFANGS